MAKPRSIDEVRKSFLDFFKSKNHNVLPSAPLVPHNDPTLMFINAGMVQFKNVFNGLEELKDKQGKSIIRATTSQKCVRAGGKHNDLDNVGYTKRHHTFFEMLGNFSFGDYFKKGAIEYAWEYLTEVLGLPKEKLVVTVYHTDDEAFELWKEIADLDDDKIIRISTNDNFWAMGDEGPCGPCSEIFYDHGEEVAGGPPGSADEDGDRFVEIWNLVFMQYDRQKDGTLNPLPNPCIDTGMGLERMATVMQGIFDNFETDLFKELISESAKLSGKFGAEFLTSHKVISDHLRSMCFLIADGVLPSNEGRGYVLRRIMRRAMRHAHRLVPNEVFVYKLIDKLIELMGDTYGELKNSRDAAIESIRNEEERFRETLGKGLKLLEKELENLEKGELFSGEAAFKLYDTYGFPYDLTEDILKEKDIQINKGAFEKAMNEQKNLARASWSGSGEKSDDSIWFDILKNNQKTIFTGYESVKDESKIISIVQDGKEIQNISDGSNAVIITDETPFYAESGGQAGDKGRIITETGEFEVVDTKKFAGELFVHIGTAKKGNIETGQKAELNVSEIRREKIKKNHSATHILHAVLREFLGNHVTQKGSLVEEDYLRFDFSHNKSVTKEEIQQIEEKVNEIVFAGKSSNAKEMAIEEAKESGALALFGEKYGDTVRVVSMGTELDNGKKYSVEFCGGIHVNNTGEIGLLRITRESAVSSGVRRIEAVTHQKALEYIRNKENVLDEVQSTLKSSENEIIDKISKTLRDKKDLEKQVSDLKKKISLGGSSGNQTSSDDNSGNSEDGEKIGNITFISKKLDDVPGKDLRGLIDEYKKKYSDAVIIIISENEGKAAIAAGTIGAGQEKISAVDIVKITSEALGGKGGGGRPDFAQGGAPSAANASEAIEKVRSSIAN